MDKGSEASFDDTGGAEDCCERKQQGAHERRQAVDGDAEPIADSGTNHVSFCAALRKRLQKAELGWWAELYGQMQERKDEEKLEEIQKALIPKPQREDEEKKWEEVTKKMTSANVKTAKSIILGKRLMNRNEATGRQVECRG